MTDDDTRPFSNRAEAELCERVLGDRRHGFEPMSFDTGGTPGMAGHQVAHHASSAICYRYAEVDASVRSADVGPVDVPDVR